jgi:hypothetical protein
MNECVRTWVMCLHMDIPIGMCDLYATLGVKEANKGVLVGWYGGS